MFISPPNKRVKKKTNNIYELNRNQCHIERDASRFVIFDHRPKIVSDNSSPRVDFQTSLR